MDRTILHARIGSFPAAIEQNRRPDLIGKPVIIGRPRGNTSGAVVSASAEARKLGVEEGMSVRQAQRTCPDAVVLQADYAAYRQASEEFMDILARYSPLLEPDSLGSAYMDVTGSRNLFGDASCIGAIIVSEVSERLRLTAFIGCASNRLLARAASGVGRPFARVRPGFESMCLAPLPVSVLDAVTGKMEKRLIELGVTEVGQLASIPEPLLVRQFGPVGNVIKKQSLGMDSSLVRAAYPPEVIKIEHMFEVPAEEPAQVEERMKEIVTVAWGKLRKRNALAGEVTLIVESGEQRAESRDDPQPSTLNSQSAYFRFKSPTDSTSHILQVLGKLLGSIMKPGMEISQVQIALSDLAPGESSQLCLIGDGERKNRLQRTIELIRERFGEGSMVFASSLAPGGRARVLSRIAA